MNIISTLAAAFLLGSTPFSSTAAFAAESSIGKVIAVEGLAKACERNLSRGASIFVSDVINVAEKSKIQIKFTDGGLLNLASSTQYKIDSYQFNSGGENQYSAELLEGGFRAVSGSIAKKNPDGFAVKTSVATIGVRGTLFEANIRDGQTYFGCSSGLVNISNGAGTRELKSGEFVSAASFNSLGSVSKVCPPALAPQNFSAPKGGESLEQALRAAPANEKSSSSGKKELQEKELNISPSQGNPSC
jgi:hypothetical protein